jgi:hypothetical protein
MQYYWWFYQDPKSYSIDNLEIVLNRDLPYLETYEIGSTVKIPYSNYSPYKTSDKQIIESFEEEIKTGNIKVTLFGRGDKWA